MWLMHDRDLQKESDTLERQYAICRGCRGLARGLLTGWVKNSSISDMAETSNPQNFHFVFCNIMSANYMT